MYAFVIYYPSIYVHTRMYVCIKVVVNKINEELQKVIEKKRILNKLEKVYTFINMLYS